MDVVDGGTGGVGGWTSWTVRNSNRGGGYNFPRPNCKTGTSEFFAKMGTSEFFPRAPRSRVVVLTSMKIFLPTYEREKIHPNDEAVKLQST